MHAIRTRSSDLHTSGAQLDYPVGGSGAVHNNTHTILGYAQALMSVLDKKSF